MTIKINKKHYGPLDMDSEHEVDAILDSLDPSLYRVKVGKQLFMNLGPKIIKKINNLGFGVFLDLKLHDIPNTVTRPWETFKFESMDDKYSFIWWKGNGRSFCAKN